MSIADKISPRQRQMIMLSSLAATSMVSLDISIANVAIPEIQGGLGVAPDQLGWILTAYMIANAIGTPLVGALVPLIGLRQLYILSVAGFGLASLACGMAGSLPELVFFRAVQGLSGAALNPLSQMLLYDIYPRERLGRAMGLFSMGVLSGSVIGPSLGGFITDVSSWRWIFLVNVPVAAVTILGLVTFLPKLPLTKTRPFDYFGFGLMAIGLCAFQLFLDRGQGKSWFESQEVIIELALAASAFYMFITHSLTARHPFIDLALFKDRNFVMGTGLNFAAGLITFMPSALTPLFLQNVQGYDVLDTGLVLTPRGVGMVVSMFFLSRIADRVDTRLLLVVGSLCLGIGFLGLRTITPDSSAFVMIWTGVIQSFGLSLTLLPLNLIAFSTLAEHLRPIGASMFNLFRSTATSAGTAVAVSYLAQSTEDNHVRLLQQISIFNPAITGPGMPQAMSVETPLSLKLLTLEVWRQASVIAFDNVFTLGALTAFSMLPLMLLIKKPAPREAREQDPAESLEMAHA